MTPTSPTPSGGPDETTLRARLRAHRALADLPDAELDWLMRHGTVRRYEVGDQPVQRGDTVAAMYVILRGRLTHFRDQGGVPRKVVDWRDGDVTGLLPYSRMGPAVGTTVADEATEALLLPREAVDEMPVTCPRLTSVLVHAMLDRAREFKSSDLELEKMASLGRLAAGLAHEFNNPASAAARSARLLTQAQEESDHASRALGQAGLSGPQLGLVDAARTSCLAAAGAAASLRSPLERADREEAIADWLADHGTDTSFAAALGDTDVTLDALTALARELPGPALGIAVRWLAAACTVRQLTHEIEQATSRVHGAVSAVKAFTYMDRGAAPEPVDVGQSLRDTLMVLTPKARERSATVTLDVAAGLPQVNGYGGELNQVWANLIDNALDAVGSGGRVTVTAVHEGAFVAVRVIDDGPGIPPDVERRIFDPFFTTKPVGSGMGLGLDIARHVVSRHEGVLTVATEPGRTEFRVMLPLPGARESSQGTASE